LSLVSYLDKIDRSIINLLRKNPDITYTEIADKVGRSQPAIGKRIKKLEDNGILSYQAGSSIRNSDFIFAKVDILTNRPKKVLKIARKCPFMPVAFKLTGENNISIIAYGHSLKFLANLTDFHFKEEIKSKKFQVILDSNEDIVLPIDLNFLNCEYVRKNNL
jgi:DNA-binding Lrp family transcriptional regulator